MAPARLEPAYSHFEQLLRLFPNLEGQFPLMAGSYGSTEGAAEISLKFAAHGSLNGLKPSTFRKVAFLGRSPSIWGKTMNLPSGHVFCVVFRPSAQELRDLIDLVSPTPKKLVQSQKMKFRHMSPPP